MNNRKAITWAMAALLILLLWDFASNALFYHPLEKHVSLQKNDDAQTMGETPQHETSWGTAIVEKNLFSETRTSRSATTTPDYESRATSEPVASMQQEQLTEVRPNVKLSGIIKNQFGEYIVYLQVASDAPVGLRRGESLMDLKVVDIEKRKVTLKWKDSTFELSMSGQSLIKR